MTSYKFGVTFFKRTWNLHVIIFSKGINLALFMLLLLISGIEQYVGYRTGLVAGKFMGVLVDKNAAEFQSAAITSTLIIIAMASTLTIRVYVTNTMIVNWRKTLTEFVHQHYFKDANFYKLNVLGLSSNIDNPDQRITSDINSFCSAYDRIIAGVVVAPFAIAYYSYDAFRRAGWIGPTGVFFFFVIGTIVNKFLMNPIVDLIVKLERKEGDFRFNHMNVRSRSESLAFYGYQAEMEACRSSGFKLSELCTTQQTVYNRQFLLNLATNLFDYMGAILSYLIISIPVFSGYYDNLTDGALANQISVNSFVCMTLIYKFSQLVDMAAVVSDLAGVTHRVAEMLEVLKCKNFPEFSGLEHKGKRDKELLRIHDLKITVPDTNRTLISNLTITVETGKHLLITGPSSVGKTSLLRVIRGLWPVSEGVIELQASSVYFLPQIPVFTEQSLGKQITYPSVGYDDKDDDWFIDLLDFVDLSELITRYGLNVKPTWNWYDVLSPGEMQRLSFLRLFYHRPELAFLDEATSALSTDMEEKLYTKCITELNTTIVSIGHRESIQKFHKEFLHLPKS